MNMSGHGWGAGIFHTLSGQLTAEFGRGFSERNLASMVRFAEVFPEIKILHTLCAKLSWSHFRRIIYLDDPLKRDFYAEMCRLEQWSARTLNDKVQSMLFERTTLSKKPDKLIAMELKQLREEDKLTPDLVFREEVLPKKQLVKKLHQVVTLARQRLQTHDKETIEDRMQS